MLKKIAATLAIVGVLTGLGAFGALSIFTSTAVVPSNAFTTGTVKISTSSDGIALITYPNMAPGDKVTEPLTVTNDGSLELRYAVTSLADDDDKGLRDQLLLTIKSGVTCDNDGFDDPGGSVLYGPDVLGSDPAPTKVIGDPAQGADTGDRTLAAAPASHSEELCFQVELPSDTDDDYQDATTTATFTFKAEQTKNNPPPP